jgi:hypothetical protein
MAYRYVYDRETDRHYLKDVTMTTSLPALISPKDIATNPTDPYRIVPFLEEVRRLWDTEPGKTFAQICCRIVETEFHAEYIKEISDGEFLAALQNCKNDKVN